MMQVTGGVKSAARRGPTAARTLPLRYWGYKYIAILAGLAAMIRCASIVTIYNHTTDELAHIAGAVGLYETGRNLYMVEHPTLQRLVVGAALKLAGVEYPRARGLEGVQSRVDANSAGADIVFRGRVPYWRVLAVARLANLLFAAFLLFFTYLLGAYLCNPLTGMLACVFLSFDANFLAHSALVTTDIPAAAGFLAATYFAIRFVARPTWGRAIAAAVALGAAMSCKFTCVLLAPAILVLILIRGIRRAKSGMGGSPMKNGFGSAVSKSFMGRPRVPRGFHIRFLRSIPKIRFFIAIPLIAIITLWATYLFNIGRLEDQNLFENEKAWRAIPQWVKETRIPMPAMPLGVMFMGAIAKTGFPCYFNGHLGLNGHLAYFPEAIAIKSPAGLMFALALALLALVVIRKNRRWMIALCLILPPSLLMLTAMTGRLQIGIRHVLPVIPFLYLFAAAFLHRGRWVYALLALMLFSAIETARVHPDYLPFFSCLIGGSEEAQLYLADSNLDWGQDMARMADWLKHTGRTDYTIKVSGVKVAELVKFLGLDPASRDRDVAELANHPHGLLILGINAKVGLEEFKKDDKGVGTPGPDYTWVRNYPLVARIGQSIEIYDLDHRDSYLGDVSRDPRRLRLRSHFKTIINLFQAAAVTFWRFRSLLAQMTQQASSLKACQAAPVRS